MNKHGLREIASYQDIVSIRTKRQAIVPNTYTRVGDKQNRLLARGSNRVFPRKIACLQHKESLRRGWRLSNAGVGISGCSRRSQLLEYTVHPVWLTVSMCSGAT